MTGANPVHRSSFRAMASEVFVTLVRPKRDAQALAKTAKQIFADHEESLSRFRPSSELSRANANPSAPTPAGPILRGALTAAHRAYLLTDGLFDPRILSALRAQGYTKNFRDIGDEVDSSGAAEPVAEATREPWSPIVTDTTVTLGAYPIDLGGIGKGYTVDQAATAIRGQSQGGMVNAGGDMVLFGAGLNGPLWRVGVENPNDIAGEPVAVLAVTDIAVATTSLSVRTWTQNGQKTHHLIDPRTGQPAWTGLLAITVLAPTATQAEILTKTLFLQGIETLAETVEEHQIPAYWVTESGTTGYSTKMAPHIAWDASQQTGEQESK